ncbi:DNA-binding response regulator [Chitinimonas prasina]|uniref:DNA-binding response regulator n=1 Tax=Chitinimonas prasina TaxID=1434937 RepID=A0ABQ5YD66_9NEIS|nr:response regulator [Chitinimonas prasina]GLR12744.1 DNA-binding response regulator [Chitinimonas prasina]
MNPPRILLVEDEPRIAEVMVAYLAQAGYTVDHLDRGDQVLAHMARQAPALLVLDLMLPGIDGISLCQQIRLSSTLPIIMVTARVEEIDRLLGFEVGADDYLCKPFSPRELVARVQALMRRSQPTAPVLPPLFDNDIVSQRIRCQGQLLSLTPQEYRLLGVLLAAPGRIYSRTQLLELAHSEGAEVFDRAVDSHIKNLRKKIAAVLGEREVIHSVYGVGYRYE